MSTDNSLKLITTVEQLHYYLIQAMKIEHATIPPYMTALYSLKPGKNLEAFHIIREVAVEEMLHLTLVANVFNAVGGKIQSTLTSPSFIPTYPTFLPTGSLDFQVSLSKFSQKTVETFRKIERSQEVPENQPLVQSRTRQEYLLKELGYDPTKAFYSIGLFYAEIIRGMYALHKQMGDALFCGDPQRQITPEYYYSGAGDIIPVTDLRSAIRALKVIQEQGEGSRAETIYDAERNLAHDFRFDQLLLGQHYQINKDDPEKSDLPHHPTGSTFTVDWDAVYPIKENAKLSDYPEGSELYAAALKFQSAYSQFLGEIEYAFDGHPEHLIPAVGGMFRLKEQANSLIRNPIPGMPGVNAAPIFRLDIDVPVFREYFLDFSAILTGFSRFDLQGTGQASLYFETIRDMIGGDLFVEVLQAFHRLVLKAESNNDESILTTGIRSQILESKKLGPIARNIIKLWYVATWYELPKDWQDAYGTKENDRTFIPSPEAYPEGLLWPAIGINPPGAKGLGYGTWSEPPLVTLS